jgi:beta-glucosidase
VVQVYASRPDSAVERPVRWLAGFAAVDAEPGQETTTTVTIPARAFEHWDAIGGNGWTVEAGAFRLDAGRSTGDLRQGADIDVHS